MSADLDLRDALEALKLTCHGYDAAFSTLQGPLESDVIEALQACWSLEEKIIQIKSRLPVSFRSRQVRVVQAQFVAEAEQQLLGAAISQWHRAAEGALASSALEVKVGERRLLHTVDRALKAAGSSAPAVLSVLDQVLQAASELGPAAAKACPSSTQLVQHAALHVGLEYLQAAAAAEAGERGPSRHQAADASAQEGSVAQSSKGGVSGPAGLEALVPVLLSHVAAAGWAAALLQPSIEQVPELLAALVEAASAQEPARLPAGQPDTAAWLRACTLLLCQPPWAHLPQLGADQGKAAVLVPVSRLLRLAVRHLAVSSADSQASMTVVVQVCQTIAEAFPGLREAVAWELMLAVLAVAQDVTQEVTCETLGLPDGSSHSALGSVPATTWAQFIWSRGPHVGAPLALHMLQQMPLEQLAAQLPSPMRIRLLLTLLAAASAAQSGTEASGPQHVKARRWIWGLLQQPAGRALCGVDDVNAEEAHVLCTAEAPPMSSVGQALWAWAQLQLGLGLLELWARSSDSAEKEGKAKALLENMTFFELPRHLTEHNHPEAAGSVMLRFVDAAVAMDHEFLRSRLPAVASTLSSALQSSSPGAADAVISPVRAALLRLINRGVAANRATQTPGSQTPDATPPASPRDRQAKAAVQAKRGSTVSPGEAALTASAQWLEVLVCCQAVASLPPSALSLMSDLVQLLYYHGSGVAQLGAAADGQDMQLLSHVVQECLRSVIAAIGPDRARALWVPLLNLETSNPREWQWLAVLACWLSNAADKIPARPPLRPAAAARPEGAPPSYEQAMQLQPAASGQHRGNGGALGRSAEEILAIQEAATSIGYGAAALPLWEEFVLRFFKHETQLGPIVPKDAISAHLAKLAQLYEGSSPVLSNIYALLAPLSPESLPGSTPRFVAENQEALRALMQLHPLNITKALSKPLTEGAGNPIRDSNPFGAVPLSALTSAGSLAAGGAAPAGSLAAGGPGDISTGAAAGPTAGHSRTSSHGQAAAVAGGTAGAHSRTGSSGQAETVPRRSSSMQVGAAGTHSRTSSAGEAAQARPPGLRHVHTGSRDSGQLGTGGTPGTGSTPDSSARSGRGAGRTPFANSPKAAAQIPWQAPPPVEIADALRDQQAAMAADMKDAQSLLRFWALKAEKQAANPDMDPGRRILRQSSDVAADQPESMAQGQARLSEVCSTWAEQVQEANAALRELVCRRFKQVDLVRVAAGDFGEQEELTAEEDPAFQRRLRENRQQALSAVEQLLTLEGLAAAAASLYQLEVLLLHTTLQPPGATSAHGGSNALELEAKSQLLIVVAEATVLGSTESASVPFYTGLFQRAVSGNGVLRPGAKIAMAARILSALGSAHQTAPRPREAAAMLSSSLGLQALLDSDRLKDFQACLRVVVQHCQGLEPALVAELLSCFPAEQFAMAVMGHAVPGGAEQAGPGASGREARHQGSPEANLLLQLACEALGLPGGEAVGSALLEGLVCSAPAQYYAACMAVALAAPHAAARLVATASMSRVPVADLPVAVLLEVCSQMSEALDCNQVKPPDVPYKLLEAILQSPCLLQLLQQVLHRIEELPPPQLCWTAKVGELHGAPGEGSSSSSIGHVRASSSGGDRAALPRAPLLLPVPARQASEGSTAVQQLVGSSLQAILRSYGSGHDGSTFAEELGQLLSAVFSSAAGAPWMVDFYWLLYEGVFQPFLALAGPASCGLAVQRFIELWESLPWQAATFQGRSPEAIASLTAHLCEPDRAVLKLLYALDWQPVLQHLGMGSATQQPTAVLLDQDISERAVSRPDLAAACGGQEGARQAWATQLLLLVVPVAVMRAASNLPSWMKGFVSETGGEILADLVAAASLTGLQELSSRSSAGTPFLLHPLAAAPAFVDPQPGPRLVHTAQLLAQGALKQGSPRAASLAAAAVRQVLLASVCRGFHSSAPPGGHPAGQAQQLEVLQCWHLSPEEHEQLVRQALLPLAIAHASLELAQEWTPEGSYSTTTPPAVGVLQTAEHSPKAGGSGTRHAPALSSLAQRLSTPHGSPSRSPGSLQAAGLAGDADQAEQSAEGQEAPGAAGSLEGGLSIYSAAAGPLQALLGSLAQQGDMALTLEVLPFANAAAPIQGTPHTTWLDNQQHQAPPTSSGTGKQHHGSPGKESSLGSLRARMTAFGKTHLGGTGSSHAAAAGEEGPAGLQAADLQLRMAQTVEASCASSHPKLALCLVRIMLHEPALASSPHQAALLESLVALLSSWQLHSQPGQPSQNAPLMIVADAAALPANSPSDIAAQLRKCPTGLQEEHLLQLSRRALACGYSLTAALAMGQLSRQMQQAEAWQWARQCSEVLAVCSQAQLNPSCPEHVAAVWLHALVWVGNARWRGLQEAVPLEQLSRLLAGLHGYAALLQLVFGHPPAEETGSLASSAADRLRSARAMLQPKTPSSTPTAQAALGVQEGQSMSQAALSAALEEEQGRTAMGKLSRGLKGMLGPRTEQPAAGASTAGESAHSSTAPRQKTLAGFRAKIFSGGSQRSPGASPPGPGGASPGMSGSPGPLPIADDPAGEGRVGEGHGQHRGPGAGTRGGHFADRLAGNIRRAMGMPQEGSAAQRQEAAQARAQAVHVLLRVGLAALAVSDYICTVLCPQLQGHEPEPALLGLCKQELGGREAATQPDSGADITSRSALRPDAAFQTAVLQSVSHLSQDGLQPKTLQLLVATQSAVPHPAACLPLCRDVEGLVSARLPATQFCSELKQLLFPAVPFALPVP